MNKLLSALKSIKPSKTVLLAAAGALIVIALIGFGAVRNVQATRAEEATAAQAAANRKAQQAQVQARIATLEREVSQYKAADSDAIALCSWIDSQAAGRRVVSPPLCSKY